MIKILYIANSGRSGSTLLARILGELPHVCNVGELALLLLFQDVQEFQVPCGCGEDELKCNFWNNLIPDYTGPIRNYLLDFKTRHLFQAWRRWRRDPEQYQHLLQQLGALYINIAVKSQSDWVIDTSTNAAIGLFLRDIPGIEFYQLHLVRDVRKVVGSWQRTKVYLPRLPSLQIARAWCFSNLIAEWISKSVNSFGMLRLEDFIAEPKRHLDRLSSLMQKPNSGYVIVPPDIVQLQGKTQHILLGNPDKFQYGNQREIQLKIRNNRIGKLHSACLSTLCYLLLKRYNYFAG